MNRLVGWRKVEPNSFFDATPGFVFRLACGSAAWKLRTNRGKAVAIGIVL
jgi:hypothetical protein